MRTDNRTLYPGSFVKQRMKSGVSVKEKPEQNGESCSGKERASPIRHPGAFL
jgi:hypothetical protein